MGDFAILVMNVVLKLYKGRFFIDKGSHLLGEFAFLAMNVFLKLYEGTFFIDMGTQFMQEKVIVVMNVIAKDLERDMLRIISFDSILLGLPLMKV